MDYVEDLKLKWLAEQQALKSRLILTDHDDSSWPPRFIGGLDISFETTDPSTRGVACLVVLSYEDLKVVYESFEQVDMQYPYLSGFLAFREVSSYQILIERVRRESPHFAPDVVLVDGSGVLHPNGFGFASHLGVSASIPTIGVAKKLLHIEGVDKEAVRKALTNPEERSTIDKSSYYALLHSSSPGSESPVGAAFLPPNVTNPIYISQGHHISLLRAIALVSHCSIYRTPEPIRQADIRSREYIRLQGGAPGPSEA